MVKVSFKGFEMLFVGTTVFASHQIVTPSSNGVVVKTSLLSVVNVPSFLVSFIMQYQNFVKKDLKVIDWYGNTVLVRML